MLDEKTIQELKDKHGTDLVAIESKSGPLVFRKPKRQEYDRWYDTQTQNKTQSGRELAQSTCVYPDVPSMFAAIDAQPALLMRRGGIIDSVCDLAGTEGEISSKKL